MISGHAARQRGLVTAAQARAAGLSSEDVRLLLTSGEWARVRRGVYAVGLEGMSEFAAAQRRRDDALCLNLEIDHVRSHTSAALVLGLAVLNSPRTHLTTRHLSASRREADLTVHVGRYLASDVVEVAGVRCSTAARTALDIAREYGVRHGVVALDSALRIGTRATEIERSLGSMRRWPGVRTARRAWALADSGAESVGETLARLLVLELGHGTPETQFGLTDGHRTAYADLRLGRHLIEFDGETKYRAENGTSAEQTVWREKQREDWLRGFRLGMSRLTWTECFRPTPEVRTRLTREYESTCRAFGTGIDDLAPYRIDRRLAG